MRTYLSNPERVYKFRLLLLDTLIVLSVFLSSYAFRIVFVDNREIVHLADRVSIPLVVMGTLAHLLFFYVFGLYENDHLRYRKLLLIKVFLAVCVSSIGVSFLSFAFPKYKMGRIVIAVHMMLLISAVMYLRIACKRFRFGQIDKNVLFVGWNAFTRRIAQSLESFRGGYVVKGLVASSTTAYGGTGDGVPAMLYSSLDDALRVNDLQTVVVMRDHKDLSSFNDRLIDLKFQGVEVYDSPTFYEQLLGRVPVSEISARWLLFKSQEEPFQPKIYLHLKRVLDILISILILLWTAPVVGLIALAIKLDSEGPVFFTQERLGQFEKPFTLLKFRTMVDNAEKDCGPCWASENDSRFTRLGKILRKTRLDEFPQFINVLKGDMSLVGPRPIRRHFADMFNEKFPFYRLRFKVKPGITGWAQVNMDYVNTEDDQYEKLEYEFYYLFHQSIFLDLFIVLKTAQSVLMMRGG